MSEERKITLTIAGILLNVTIIAEQEEIIRKAAKMLNESILAKENNVKEPELHYYLAFTALVNAVKLMRYEQGFDDVNEICKKIDEVIQ